MVPLAASLRLFIKKARAEPPCASSGDKPLEGTNKVRLQIQVNLAILKPSVSRAFPQALRINSIFSHITKGWTGVFTFLLAEPACRPSPCHQVGFQLLCPVTTVRTRSVSAFFFLLAGLLLSQLELQKKLTKLYAVILRSLWCCSVINPALGQLRKQIIAHLHWMILMS